LRTIPTLMRAIMMVDVASPIALPIRYAGGAARDYVGFEATGMDLLDLTESASRELRFTRFQRQVSHPCGSQALTPLRTSRGAMVLNDAIWLPYRRRSSGDVVLIGYLGLRLQRLSEGNVDPVMPLAQRFAYVDLGHGLPDPSLDPSAEWPQ
jgi:hypothetical protein